MYGFINFGICPEESDNRNSMKELNKYSKTVTQDPTQPAAQAMLYAIGLTTEDFFKPMIGIASTGYEGNPCNMHLNDLAKLVKDGTKNEDIIGLIFNTIGVSDGISICSNVVIGMGSVVTKSIMKPGVYFGVPAKLK